MANKKLSIYAQSGEGTRGQLMAISTDEGTAGIGGTTNHYMGNLTVHGGVLTVQGGKRAAGIGSGWYNKDPKGHWYQEPSGYMTVYDGNISSIGGEGGAGIGGGCGYKNIGQRGLETATTTCRAADSTARPTSPAFTSGTGRRYTRSDCENLSWQVLTDRTRKPQGRNALGLLFQRTSRRRRETRRLLLQSGVIRICFPGRQRK